MEFRSTTAAATLVIGALTLGAAPAHAQQPETPNLAYSTTLVDKTVVTVLRGGTFELSKGTRLEDGGVERLTERDGTLVRADGSAADPARTVDIVDVKDATGAVAVALPLDFRFGEVSVTVRPALDEDDTVLRLTPEKPAGLDISQPLAVKPVASEVENQRALNNLATHFGLATAIGGFVGTAIGATIGCVATLVAGCIGGLATGASVGGIIGTIVAGGPALIATGIEYLTTVQAPDGTTRWADKPKPQPAAPAQAEPAK